MYLFLENERNIMSSHYLDNDAENALDVVIAHYKSQFGIIITFSQAVLIMFSDYKNVIGLPGGGEKQ